MLSQSGPNPFHIDWTWAKNDAKHLNGLDYDYDQNDQFGQPSANVEPMDDIHSMHYPHYKRHSTLKEALEEQKDIKERIDKAYKSHSKIE